MGTIFNRTLPIANVTVWAETSATRDVVPTDKNGRFLITGLSPGKVKIIAADSGKGLRAMGEVDIPDHGIVAHLDLILQPGGSLVGRLFTAKGPPAGRNATVTARTTGGLSFQTLTNDAGLFRFDPLPMETVYLTATDLDGNVAEGSIRLVEADQPLHLQFFSRGDVFGTVLFGGGDPVAYAQVAISGARGERRAMNADENGRFSFDRIFAGAFTVTGTDPVTHLSEYVYSELPSIEGTKKEIAISLTRLGDVKGVVYSAVGHKPVIGVNVTLHGQVYRPTQTDAEGRFEFRQLPIGAYSLSASNADGDYANAVQVALAKHGEKVVQEITLVGFGEVVVTVTSPLGVPIVSADVSIAGPRARMNALTDDRGVASFQAITAGGYNVQAKFNTSFYSRISVPFTVEAGKKSQITLTLKSGTVRGKVLSADRLTPVAGVEVSLGGYWWGRKTITDDQGGFSFSSVDDGNYSLEAWVKGRLRANKSISLRDREVKTEEMVLTPVGTVTGYVYDPSGAPLAFYGAVTLGFVDTRNGSLVTAYTQADGSYTLEQMPLGPFVARGWDYRNAWNNRNPLAEAEADGVLSYDGEVVVLNLRLADNRVDLPTALSTAEAVYPISREGRYTFTPYKDARSSPQSLFYRGCDLCNQLTLTVNGQTASFPTKSFGKYEDDRREIGITSEDHGGIVVTRKLFVPRRGYAARLLELLTNPTDEPVNAAIKISSLSWSKHPADSGPPFVRSDKGWMALSGKEKEGPIVIGIYGHLFHWGDRVGDEAMGFVFGGSVHRGKPFQQNPEPRNVGTFAWFGKQIAKWETEVIYGMEEIVIEPGETVGFLHFHAFPWDKEGEQPILARLKGLPPEMLEGLSEEERSSIINFDFTQDRDLQLSPLPMISKLSVHVFQKAGDQLLPMPNARIDFKSTDPIFPLTHHGVTDGDGLFIADYKNLPWAWHLVPPLPTGPIDIRAFAQVGAFDEITDKLAALSPQKIAVDSEGELSADIVFTQTGAVDVVFERPSGITGNAHLALTHKDTGKGYNVHDIVSPASAATILGLPPGQYQLGLTINHPQERGWGRGSLRGSNDVSISASQKADVGLSIEPTGHLEGAVKTLSGQQVSGLLVTVGYSCTDKNEESCAGRLYSTYADHLGRYQFVHLPVGHARLMTTANDTGIKSAVDVMITQGATVYQDLVLAPFLSLQVKVILPNGKPANGSVVALRSTRWTKNSFGETQVTTETEKVVTDQQGIVRFKILPEMSYIARAFRPEADLSKFFAEQPFEFKAEGDLEEEVVVPLPSVGTVSVKVESPSGRPVEGEWVDLIGSPQYSDQWFKISRPPAYGGGYYYDNIFRATTDKEGLTEPIAWAGPITVRKSPSGRSWPSVPITKEDLPPAEGEARIVVIRLQAVADLKVRVTHCGDPAPGRGISITIKNREDEYGHGPEKQSTNEEGLVLFKNITEGEFILNLLPGLLHISGPMPVTISASDDGGVKFITIPFCEISISGQVVAADGKTGIPGAVVSFENANWDLGQWESTDDSGHFSADLEIVDGMDLAIEASFHLEGNYLRAVQTVVVDSEKDGEIIVSPLVLPLSALQGSIHRIYRGTPEPVTDATLFTISPGFHYEGGTVRSDLARLYKGGRYLFLGLPVGDFEITAHTSNNGQTETRQGRIEAIDQAVELDIAFPPLNDLRVLLEDADGNPLKQGSVAVDQIGSPFTIYRDFELGWVWKEGEWVFREEAGSVWKDRGWVLKKTGLILEGQDWVWKEAGWALEEAGWVWIDQGWIQEDGEFVWNGEEGELVLERLPAGVGLVIAVRSDDVISPPQFIVLPATDERLTTTLSLPQTMSWGGMVPTPFGLVGGEDLTGKDTKGNALSSRLFDDTSSRGTSALLDASLRLTIGKRAVQRWGGISWIEGEAVLFPSESVGSLLVSRRFIHVPESERGVLSIDQVTNPYSVPIEVEIGIDLSDNGLGINELKYRRPGAVILLDFGAPGKDNNIPRYIVFGSSLGNQGPRVVVPAFSCRSVVHLWDSLPFDGTEGYLSKGIDLLSRFAALDFKSIILEEKSCPLAE